MASNATTSAPWLEPSGKNYKLAVDWHADCAGLLERPIELQEGYTTDGATVPWWLWPICGTPMQSPRICAAIVHDWLYDVGGPKTKRKDVDKLYRDYNIQLGMKQWAATVEYWAIRLFGGRHWNEHS